jgi:hypothetical protein
VCNGRLLRRPIGMRTVSLRSCDEYSGAIVRVVRVLIAASMSSGFLLSPSLDSLDLGQHP